MRVQEEAMALPLRLSFTVFVPSSVAAPVTANRSEDEPFRSKTKLLAFSESVPAIVLFRVVPSAKLSVAPLALRSEVSADKAEAPLKRRVPAVAETVPLFVLVPLSVVTPRPEFTRDPGPLRLLETV
jgi:hypothetical protein